MRWKQRKEKKLEYFEDVLVTKGGGGDLFSVRQGDILAKCGKRMRIRKLLLLPNRMFSARPLARFAHGFK